MWVSQMFRNIIGDVVIRIVGYGYGARLVRKTAMKEFASRRRADGDAMVRELAVMKEFWS